MQARLPEPYGPLAARVFGAIADVKAVTTAADVAEVVFRAANDASEQLRFPAGPDAVALAGAR